MRLCNESLPSEPLSRCDPAIEEEQWLENATTSTERMLYSKMQKPSTTIGPILSALVSAPSHPESEGG